MPERIPETLQKRLADRFSFYQDLGIRLFYRDRGKGAAPHAARRLERPDVAQLPTIGLQRETTLPKPTGKLALQKIGPAVPPGDLKIRSLPVPGGPALFQPADR